MHKLTLTGPFLSYLIPCDTCNWIISTLWTNLPFPYNKVRSYNYVHISVYGTDWYNMSGWWGVEFELVWDSTYRPGEWRLWAGGAWEWWRVMSGLNICKCYIVLNNGGDTITKYDVCYDKARRLPFINLKLSVSCHAVIILLKRIILQYQLVV